MVLLICQKLASLSWTSRGHEQRIRMVTQENVLTTWSIAISSTTIDGSEMNLGRDMKHCVVCRLDRAMVSQHQHSKSTLATLLYSWMTLRIYIIMTIQLQTIRALQNTKFLWDWHLSPPELPELHTCSYQAPQT